MNRFTVNTLPLPGLMLIERPHIGDSRGFFSRLFCAEELSVFGWNKPIAQINHSQTARRGTVRGIHFQLPPDAEAKLVICLHGEIFDLAVDLRMNSPTFLHWHGVHLSAENQRSVLIPEGFAHGFQTLTDDCELIYLHSAAYRPEAEGAVNATDPRLAIKWPLEISEMSDRDRNHPLLDAQFEGIEL